MQNNSFMDVIREQSEMRTNRNRQKFMDSLNENEVNENVSVFDMQVRKDILKRSKSVEK